ncbi:MAG: bifunctional DNA primase/polymerase [Planctomycetota bacterium]|nr:bifunctional DNA primase/polymerase [Planctomycetota bacterium]
MTQAAPSIDQFLTWDFPLIPLGRRSKAPIAKGWQERRFERTDLGRGNIGTRAGETVNVDGRSGVLYILDFDSDDLACLKAMCRHFDLPRSTCVRTGGQHRGYHLFYLVDEPVRKSAGLAFHDAPIDIMGTGSFVVLPPSIVEREYRVLVGFDEITTLSAAHRARMDDELRRWGRLRRSLRKAADADERATIAQDPDLNPAMRRHAREWQPAEPEPGTKN